MLFTTMLALLGAAIATAQRSCAPTVREEGTINGKMLNIGGIQSYVSYPSGPRTKTSDTAILFLTDIFGIPRLQQKLLGDSMAAASYLVVMPDLFNGDPIAENAFGSPGFDFSAWQQRHNTADVDAIIEKTIAGMKQEMGVKRIGGVGYCFGGKYVPRFLAQGKGLDVGFVAHPSSLENSEIEAVLGPLAFALADGDNGFNATRRATASNILQRKNETYEMTLYSGVEHGFAVKTDVSVKQKRYAKQSAFVQAIRWFDVWLRDVENGYPFH